MLTVIETHPVQYHAPIYRILQQHFQIPVTAIYGSDFSVGAYQDEEFHSPVSWDTDLLSGYTSVFLSHSDRRGAESPYGISSKGLREALRKIYPSVILMPGYGFPFYQKAFLQIWRTPCRLFLRGETTDYAVRRGVVKTWLRDQLLKQIYSRCEKLLYIGRYSYLHFKRLGCPEEKLIFSPYGVDTAPFELEESARDRLRLHTRQRLGIPQDQIVLTFSGKLSSRKGPDLILEAVKKLAPEVSRRMTLFFIGDGELKSSLEKSAQEIGRGKSYFFGVQSQQNLSSFYHASDLLVLPSRYKETWGLVVNEALHHGLPCVVSDAVGCMPDLIEAGKTGEVFEAGSPKSLSNAIQRALSFVGRPDVRAACKEKVAGYTIEKAAEGVAKAYRDVVRQN